MSSRGNSGPSDTWVEVHDSSFDSTGGWIFDVKGEDVDPEDIECSATYYAMVSLARNVRRCPNPIRLFLLRFKVRRKARRLARSVADSCENKRCRSRISFQYEAWFFGKCNGLSYDVILLGQGKSLPASLEFL